MSTDYSLDNSREWALSLRRYTPAYRGKKCIKKNSQSKQRVISDRLYRGVATSSTPSVTLDEGVRVSKQTSTSTTRSARTSSPAESPQTITPETSSLSEEREKSLDLSFFLENHFDFDSLAFEEQELLHEKMTLCIHKGDFKTIYKLIENGYGANRINNQGWTPFMQATYYGQIDLMANLSGCYGVNPNGYTQRIGLRPIQIAIEKTQRVTFQFLVSQLKVKVDVLDPRGMNLIEFAKAKAPCMLELVKNNLQA
ncbi:MAG: ankyrin repeat domain-containing protein [Chlamydiales bacterium]|nr:ankyrin repeat domain-containing protein [Chlamydiales bacterium]